MEENLRAWCTACSTFMCCSLCWGPPSGKWRQSPEVVHHLGKIQQEEDMFASESFNELALVGLPLWTDQLLSQNALAYTWPNSFWLWCPRWCYTKQAGWASAAGAITLDRDMVPVQGSHDIPTQIIYCYYCFTFYRIACVNQSHTCDQANIQTVLNSRAPSTEMLYSSR